VTTTSLSTLFTLGCNQGSFDADHGTDSLVFLDFGGQVSGGTDLTDDDNTFVTDSQIEALAYQFAEGYYDCAGPNDPTTVLTLAVGTNNSLGVSESYGSDWGNLVKAVANNTSTFASQVLIWGGSDLEPAWSSWSDVQDWIKGYSSVNPPLYLNYGSADGCTQTTDENGGCNTAGINTMSGMRRGVPLSPQ